MDSGNRERWSLITPACHWCDYTLMYSCKGDCPDFKERKKWGNKKYRQLWKTRVRKEMYG